jgi:hypothetical protein
MNMVCIKRVRKQSKQWILVCRKYHAVHEVPLHDLKFSVWYTVSAWRIIGPLFW